MCNPDTARRARTGLRTLVTKEDPVHFHKAFDIFAFVHFFYRVAHAGPADMNFSADSRTEWCVGGHAMLSLSSLIFRLPAKRIAEGSRIWPEFRLHSIVFACRSLACLALTW